MQKRFHRFRPCPERATPAAATRRIPAAMSWKWIRGRAHLPSRRSCARCPRWDETNPVPVGPAASTSTATAPFSKRAVESGGEPLSRDIPSPSVHVVAAAVIDATGRVLIAQRPAGTHLAGGWEFPGGKLEPGEARLAGLARELREELGITIATPRPLIRVRHAYPSREVLLDIWVVTRYSGEPQGLDGQALRWCTQDELAVTALLPADKPIVAALRFPERFRP